MNRFGATRAVPLGIFKAFDRVWHASLLHKLKCCGISGQIFNLISSFSVIDGFKVFWMAILHKNIQLMLEFLGPTLFCYTLMIFLMMLSMILLSMLMILLSKCDQAFDLWQPLELACEL